MSGSVAIAPRPRLTCLRFARGVSLFAILMGGLVLVGWFFDVAILKGLRPGLETMKANTALGFILSGVSLLLQADPSKEPSLRPRRSGLLLAGLTTLLGVITLAEYGLDWNPGLDELLIRDPAATVFPGRMAPTTALCFTLLGVGLCAAGLRLRRPIHPLVPGLMATLIACLAVLVLFGYFAGVSATYDWGPFTSMAAHTAAGFLLLSTGLVTLAHAQHPGYPLDRWLSLSAALVTVLLLGLLTRASRSETVEVANLVHHTQVFQSRLGKLGADLANVQIGSRGFVITGQEPWLEPHRLGTAAVAEQLRELRQLSPREPAQLQRLTAVESVSARLVAWYRELAETRRREGFPAAQQRVLTGRGEQLLAEAQALVLRLDQAEQRLLEERERLLAQRRQETARLLTAGTMSALLFIGFAGGVAQRELGRRIRVEQALRQTNEHLEDRVRVRTSELNRSVKSLQDEIARRTQAEDALQGSVKETGDLRAALNEHAVVAITDPQGTITFINDKFCALSGYARAELLGQDHRRINSGHHSKEFFRHLWTTISGGRVWQGEIKNRANDGTCYWVATTIVPLLDADGRPRQYVTISADITAHKQAEQDVRYLNAQLSHRVTQLEASNQELEAFSYSVSHDLRAPLRGIDGFARLLEDDYGAQLDAEGRRRLHIIRSETQRMGQLIDALLAFSRLGRQALVPGRIDLQALAQDVWTTLVRPTPERAVQLVCPALPPAQGDTILLQQVFSNLLGNALKFTRHQPAPVIEVGGTAGPTEHTYFVRDNGAGFDPRHAGKLFGVFQRLHRESEFEGAGIGLALVQRIVHRHGGRIWAEGTPGRGATFFFTLPAEPDHSP